MEGLASLDELLVALGLGVVLLLGGLVSKGVLAGGEAGADGGVGVLSDLLVGLWNGEKKKVGGAISDASRAVRHVMESAPLEVVEAAPWTVSAT